jgi:hypothetical protein
LLVLMILDQVLLVLLMVVDLVHQALLLIPAHHSQVAVTREASECGTNPDRN